MVMNEMGQGVNPRGSKITYHIGDIVRANSTSRYTGLVGTIFEIRTGRDKATDNEGPDFYVTFEKPTDPKVIAEVEKRFSEIYGKTTIDEVVLDEAILSADEIGSFVFMSATETFTPKARKFTFRMCAEIKFNRAVDPDKDYISPGGYEFVMNGKTVCFDFCDYEGGRKPGRPSVVEFVQKNPDYDTFEDLKNVTEDDLKNVEKIEEFFVYLGEDGESEGLEPVKVEHLWFEVIPMTGKSYTIECKQVMPYVFPQEG